MGKGTHASVMVVGLAARKKKDWLARFSGPFVSMGHRGSEGGQRMNDSCSMDLVAKTYQGGWCNV
jgi:hypothetical protein